MLTAGGRYADKQIETENSGPDETEESETEKEEEEQEHRHGEDEQGEEEMSPQLEEDDKSGQGQTHFAQVHASATRVSTQTRSTLDSNERVVIGPQNQTILVVREKEAEQLRIQFPNLKHTIKEELVGWKWTKKTQPVMIHGKTPGLITNWRAPFEKGIDKPKRRWGKMTVTIINPTDKKLKLPVSIKITNYKPARFIKEIGTANAEALLVLGPEDQRTRD